MRSEEKNSKLFRAVPLALSDSTRLKLRVPQGRSVGPEDSRRATHISSMVFVLSRNAAGGSLGRGAAEPHLCDGAVNWLCVVGFDLFGGLVVHSTEAVELLFLQAPCSRSERRL